MAIRGNIGAVGAAIEEGRRAFANVDYGPVIPSALTNPDNSANSLADWTNQVIDPNIFVFGVHKWGDPILKVTK